MAEEPRLSGTILEWAKRAPRSAVSWGDIELAQSREVLFRSWISDSRNLRRILNDTSQKLTGFITEDSFSSNDGRLLNADKNRIQRNSSRAISHARKQIESEIEDGVESAIRRAQLSQERHLQRLGLRRLDQKTRMAIREMSLKALDEEFPRGSGKSFRMRLEALEKRHIVQVNGISERTFTRGGASEIIPRDIDRGLTFRGPGNTTVRGGSMYRQSQRLMVAEETRLANMVEVKTVQAMGVMFAYWRLNPSHKWYGGKEICEHYAYKTNPDVVAEFHRLGISTSGISFNGLYKVMDWPQYPHPYCKCYPEALYLPSYRQSETYVQSSNEQASIILGELIALGLLTFNEI